MEADSAGNDRATSRRPYLIALAVLMALSAALLMHYRTGLNFLGDDWTFVIYRHEGNVGDFLDPHNEHISVIPVAIFKIFIGAFGMDSPIPLHIFSVSMFLLCVLVVFFYLKPLTGEPLALIGCAVLLFLGSAWEDLLWIFQLGFSISLASGVGALIMLRKDNRTGDRLACLCLLVSILSTSLGIAFIAGAAVDLLLRRRDLWRRIWIIALPAAVYAVWWLGWGHTASNGLSVENAIDSPKYVLEAFRLSVGVVTGAFRIGGGHSTNLMRLLGIAVVVAVITYLYRKKTLPRPFLTASAVSLSFWGLAALNQIPGRDFGASRYQLPGAIFLLMMLAGALDGDRVRARFVGIAGAVAVFAIAVNIEAMGNGYRDWFKPLSDTGTAGLTALETVRQGDSPATLVDVTGKNSSFVDSVKYFEEEATHGSAAWSESEIGAQSDAARELIDLSILGLLPLTMETEAGAARRQCRKTRAEPSQPVSRPVPAARFSIRPDEQVFILLRRFADSGTKTLLVAEAGKTTVLNLPDDNSDREWRVAFEGKGKVTVCAA